MLSCSRYVRRAIGTMTIKGGIRDPSIYDPRGMGKDYEIVCVSRGDLQTLGLPIEQIDRLTDADMCAIAQEMLQLYVDRVFWDDLRFVVRVILAEKEGMHETNR